MEPRITAVMITGKDPARAPLALRAIAAFLDQTYTNKQLLVVNDGEPLAIAPQQNIRSLNIPPGHTLGQLRNIALDWLAQEIADSWVIQWDDDDWYHPDRITQQYAAVREQPRPCYLHQQIRYSFISGSAFVRKDRQGIPGTILHPPTTLRYRDEPKHEDSHFRDDWGAAHVMFDNPPSLYLRFHHGKNTWSGPHIMGAKYCNSGIINLDSADTQLLRQVLAQYKEIA